MATMRKGSVLIKQDAPWASVAFTATDVGHWTTVHDLAHDVKDKVRLLSVDTYIGVNGGRYRLTKVIDRRVSGN